MSLSDQLKQNDFTMCGCMGPQGNDPHCPCEMRRLGLTASGFTQPITTAEKVKLSEMFNKYEVR